MASKRGPQHAPSPEITGDLWQAFTRLKTLDMAWEKVRANGGCAGGDGVSIRQFQQSAAKRLTDLARQVQRGEYQPADLRLVDIPKKKGGTRRLVIPSVRDRVLQTAMAQILTPILDPQFEDSSFAYRPGRSVKQAVHAIGRWRDLGYWHVIEADIVQYFDNIRHNLLLDKLEHALAAYSGTEPVSDLIGFWLEHQGQQTGHLGHGVAQGSPLSPLLANLYLDAMDEQLAVGGVKLVRFADDFILLCKKRKTAEDALAHSSKAITGLGLALHPDGTRVVDFARGFEFLGHMFVRSMTLQQISDPEEDAVSLLRDIANTDDQSAEVAQARESASMRAVLSDKKLDAKAVIML